MNPIITKAALFIKDNFLFVIITMLVSIIMLQNCDRNREMVQAEVKIDTVIKHVKGDIVRLPPIVKVIPGEKETEYIADPNYDKLLIQYNKLVESHISKNISVDTININKDGLTGFIRIEDTVNKNKIIGRKISYNFDYPIVTKTITEHAPKRTEVYYGGGLMGSDKLMVEKASVGLLLKTKNDKIYIIHAGLGIDGHAVVGLQAFWKIKLGK